MIPSLVVSEVREALVEYLATTFALSDDETRQALQAAKLDPAASAHPSVETVLHALCLALPGVTRSRCSIRRPGKAARR